MISRRFTLKSIALFAGIMPAICHFSSANAQDFSAKPITIVVPFAPGGGVDIVARLLAEKLRPALNTSVVVDNKPGASGMLGALAVVKAPADGHTLLLGSAGETAINPFVFKAKMQYQPSKDLAPISLVTRIPNVLVTRPDFPAKTTAELVAYAKKNPGKLSYSSSGVGNPQNLNGELLKELGGIFMVHIPYRGASGQLVDVTSGVVDMTFVSYAAARSFIQSGKVKAIAVSSAKRAPFAPELPALSETKGFEKYQLDNWFGMFAPAGTPEPVIAKINAAVTAALRDPDLVKRLRDQGSEPSPMSAAQFRDFIKVESAQFERIVKVANITAE